MDANTPDPMAEIKAIEAVAKALSGLEGAAIARVLRWATDMYGLQGVQGATVGVRPPSTLGTQSPHSPEPEIQAYGSVADFYSDASPSSDPERALVIGYWMQFVEGKEEFDSQTLNSHLKNLGHGVSNITKALTSLKIKKPNLVIQTRKTGSSQQARKKYKLTAAGKQSVEEMLNNGE